jgi:hypothetical protein
MNTNVSFASASDTREQKPTLRELAPDVYGYISDFDPNCGFVVGDEQVVLIDTRPTPRMARDFLAAIRTVTDKPIKTIVLTHYHAVRVMGASAFDEVQAIVASNGTLDWIRTRGQADFDSEVGRFPRLFAGVEEIPGLTFPTMSFAGEMSLWLGGRAPRTAPDGAGPRPFERRHGGVAARLRRAVLGRRGREPLRRVRGRRLHRRLGRHARCGAGAEAARAGAGPRRGAAGAKPPAPRPSA